MSPRNVDWMGVALLLIGLLMLASLSAAHPYSRPHVSPAGQYQHSVAPANESLNETGERMNSDDLSTIGREWFRKTVTDGTTAETGSDDRSDWPRTWIPTVCKEHLVYCDGYATVPDDFEYGQFGTEYVIVDNGTAYEFETVDPSPPAAFGSGSTGFDRTLYGLLMPGLIVFCFGLATVIRPSAFGSGVRAVGIGSGGIVLALAYGSPYLAMFDILSVGAAHFGAMVVLFVLLITSIYVVFDNLSG